MEVLVLSTVLVAALLVILALREAGADSDYRSHDRKKEMKVRRRQH